MARSAPAPVNFMSALGFKIWGVDRTETDGTMAAPHTHADIEINYLAEGWIRYFHGGRFYEIAAGQMGVFWAGIPHQLQEQSARMRGVWVTFPVNWMLGWQLPGRLQDALMSGAMATETRTDSYEAQTDGARMANWLALYESDEETQRRIVMLELESRLRRMEAPAAAARGRKGKGTGPGDQQIRQFVRMTEVLAQRFMDPIAVDDVAEALGLHPKYCLALFKKSCGMTLWHYLVRLRLAHAERLLLTTGESILQIALQSGFGSSSAFYLAFKKHTGQTPLQFRKQHRG